MNIDITARNFHISDNLKDLIQEKINKLLIYNSSIFLIEVVL